MPRVKPYDLANIEVFEPGIIFHTRPQTTLSKKIVNDRLREDANFDDVFRKCYRDSWLKDDLRDSIFPSKAIFPVRVGFLDDMEYDFDIMMTSVRPDIQTAGKKKDFILDMEIDRLTIDLANHLEKVEEESFSFDRLWQEAAMNDDGADRFYEQRRNEGYYDL